tara:strand:+ start:9625 stop:10017 length:393 start_codon:yes stop_codon:yes gene_type:complete
MLPWLDKGEILRFSLTGGSSALIYLAILYLTIPVIGLLAASLVGYTAAMIVNYAMQRTWTFKSDRAHKQTVPRFFVTHLGGILINAGIMALLVETMSFPILPSQILAFVAIAAWSYVLQKIWVFSLRPNL